jgi:signal transduction histidine kinase
MLIPERLRDIHAEHRQRYFEHPSKRPMGIGRPLVGLRKDEQEVPVEISLSPISSGGRTFALAAVRDVSEQNRLREREASLRTILETEQERHRIGMDLHDGIMQDIYAVSLGLGLAEDDVDKDTALAKAAISRSIDQLHNVIRDIRSYIFDLRPRQVTGNLGDALLELGGEFQQNSSIQTNVDIDRLISELDHNVGVAFYVITHEALSNARKYAQANAVTIRLFSENGTTSLEVKDDGDGFDTSAELPEAHRGLRNMASRANMVGAMLKIESAPGQGTAIQVDFRPK